MSTFWERQANDLMLSNLMDLETICGNFFETKYLWKAYIQTQETFFQKILFIPLALTSTEICNLKILLLPDMYWNRKSETDNSVVECNIRLLDDTTFQSNYIDSCTFKIWIALVMKVGNWKLSSKHINRWHEKNSIYCYHSLHSGRRGWHNPFGHTLR